MPLGKVGSVLAKGTAQSGTQSIFPHQHGGAKSLTVCSPCEDTEATYLFEDSGPARGSVVFKFLARYRVVRLVWSPGGTAFFIFGEVGKEDGQTHGVLERGASQTVASFPRSKLAALGGSGILRVFRGWAGKTKHDTNILIVTSTSH